MCVCDSLPSKIVSNHYETHNRHKKFIFHALVSKLKFNKKWEEQKLGEKFNKQSLLAKTTLQQEAKFSCPKSTNSLPKFIF